MTITVTNGSRVSIGAPWAKGKAGFTKSGDIIELAYEPVAGEIGPEIGDSLTVQSIEYVIYDRRRHASTQLRVLALVAVED